MDTQKVAYATILVIHGLEVHTKCIMYTEHRERCQCTWASDIHTDRLCCSEYILRQPTNVNLPARLYVRKGVCISVYAYLVWVSTCMFTVLV